MANGGSDLYREAGVDIGAADRALARIKPLAQATRRAEVIGGIGGFGAGFLFAKDRYDEPVLVSGTDGVGTKLKIAFALDRHDTVGIDCVAMCVNDILAMGAEPLFFLDYFATGRLAPAVLEAVVAGVAQGCRQAGAALIGGETAEMPGMYADGEYDLAGFAVGVAERRRYLDGAAVRPGDVLIGLPSSGAHANGFSLIRKLLAEAGVGYGDRPPGWERTVGETLLAPTRIYARAARALLASVEVRAMAHITGGGLVENLPRVLPDGLGCVVDPGSWPLPPVFAWLAGLAGAPFADLCRTWNMGIGYVAVVPGEEVGVALAALAEAGEAAHVIGRVEAGFRGVRMAEGGVAR